MNKDRSLDMDDILVITKALSDKHRVRAFMALRRGELCVCQIIELLGLAPSTVSKHMSVLRQARLVESRKDSRWVYYRLAKAGNQGADIDKIVKPLIALLERDERVRADDAKIARISSESLEKLCKRQRAMDR